jgi:hypothetical protein
MFFVNWYRQQDIIRLFKLTHPKGEYIINVKSSNLSQVQPCSSIEIHIGVK